MIADPVDYHKASLSYPALAIPLCRDKAPLLMEPGMERVMASVAPLGFIRAREDSL
jgi:hypothetical protein